MWWCVQRYVAYMLNVECVNFWCPSLVVPCCTTVVPIFVSMWTFSPSGNCCTGLRGRPIVCDLNKRRDVVQSEQVWYSKYSNTFSDRVLLCSIYRCSLVSSTHFSWRSALPPFLVYLTGRVLLTYSWPQLSKCEMMRLDLIISSNNNWYIDQLWQSLI